MSRDFTESEINRSEKLVVRDESNQKVQTVIFPHATQVGLTDSRYQSNLTVQGFVKVGELSATPNQPPDGSGGIFYVKSDGKPYFRSYEQAEVDLTSGGGGGAGGAVSSVANGANNRVATFSSANALNGEANLTFDGTDMVIAGSGKMAFRDNGAEAIYSVADGTLGIAAQTEIDLTSATIEVNGILSVSSDIRHTGDSDTKIVFGSDKIQHFAGGNEYIKIVSEDVGEGSVVINDGSASDIDFRVESNNNTSMLFVDASTDRVGIGTTTPTCLFEVGDGTGFFNQMRLNSGGHAEMVLNTGGNYRAVVNFDDDGTTYYSIGSNGGNRFEISRTDAMNGSGFFVHNYSSKDIEIGENIVSLYYDYSNSGRFGIGTNTPGKELDVYGEFQTSGPSPTIFLKNTNNEHGDGQAESSVKFVDHSYAALATIEGSHEGSSDDTKGQLRFFTHDGSSETERMRLTSAGKLGIGTTSPTYELDVRAANARAQVKSSGSTALMFIDAAAGHDSILYFRESGNNKWLVGNDATDDLLKFDNNNGFPSPAMTISTAGVVTATQFAGTADVASAVTLSPNSSDATNYITFGPATSGNQSLRTNSTLQYNPSSRRISMSADTTAWTALSLQNDDDTSNSAYTDVKYRMTDNDDTTVDAAILRVGKTQGWQHDNESTKDAYFGFQLRNNNSLAERMRLTSAGRLGIGTTSPTYELDVRASNARAQVKSSGSTALMFIDAAANHDAVLYFRENGSNKWLIGHDATDDLLKFDNNNGFASPAMTVSTAGVVTATEFVGSFTGGASLVNLADSETDADHFITYAAGASGNQALKTDGGLKYNPSSNLLTVWTTGNSGEYIPLRLYNKNANAAAEVSARFDLSDTSNNTVQAGKIKVTKDQEFTSTVGTQDASMTFQLVANGNLIDRATLSSAGNFSCTSLSATTTSTSFLNVATSIQHTGDTHTKIAFGDDQIDFYAGNVKMLTLDETTQDVVTINADEADIDFEVRYDSGLAFQVNGTTGTTTVSGHLAASSTITAVNTIQGADLRAANDVSVGANITHFLDDHTKIAFSSDQIDFYAGNVKLLTLEEDTQDTVVINEGAADVDFRVESSSNTHMIFSEGSTNRVGIGTSSPGHTLDVNGIINGSDAIRTSGFFLAQKSGGGPAQIILRNNTNEHANLSAESEIQFRDHANNNLAKIVGAHHDANDDAKGKLLFYTNSGDSEQLSMVLEPDFGGQLGIGTSDPRGARLVIKQSEEPGTNNQPGNAIRIIQSDSSQYWQIGLDTDPTGPELVFRFNGGDNGGYMLANADRDDFTFTGQHFSIPLDENPEAFKERIGMIVVSEGEYVNISQDTTKPTINESLPKISLSTKRNQKTVYGVVSSVEDSSETIRKRTMGVFGTISEKKDTRVIVNSLGEGAAWVCDINGALENGDYITSCEIPGFGMKQDDDLLHSYTVAKITQDCDFDLSATEYDVVEFEHEGQTYRKAFVGCTYHCG